MPVIGVIGRKGGSGKTTIAVHLAAVFATQGKNVALVDADTQGSATYWAEPGHLPMQVVHRPLEHDREILAWSVAVRDIDAELLVLDAPPHLNEALGGVIGLSDIALVPCGPSGLDLLPPPRRSGWSARSATNAVTGARTYCWCRTGWTGARPAGATCPRR